MGRDRGYLVFSVSSLLTHVIYQLVFKVLMFVTQD